MLDAVEDAPPAAAQPTGPVTADFGRRAEDGPAQSVSFNFRNAPWEDVLTLFADTAGLSLDLAEVPPGYFTYYDRNEYTPDEALNILNGYLLPRGYLLLRRNNFLVSTAVGEGVSPNLVLTSLPERLEDFGENQFVRVVFDTGETEAKDLVKDINNLLGDQGKAVAMGESNRLVVEDVVRNLIDVRQLISSIVTPTDPNSMEFKAFRLRYVLANDAEPLIRKLVGADLELGTAQSSSGRSGDPRAMFMEMMKQRMGGGSSSGKDDPKQARVVVDERTNSLLVTAKPGDLVIVEQAIEEIDVGDEEVDPRANSENNGPTLRVYKVDDGDLTRIAETLETMVPGISVNKDERADQIHVIATPSRHTEVAQLMDVILGRGQDGTEMTVVQLNRMDPTTAAYLVQDMFLGERTPPTAQPSPDGRALVVRGTRAAVTQVKAMFAQLGETGQARQERRGGPVREFSLGGRDPEMALRMLEQLWNAGHAEPLRVVRPGQLNRTAEEPRDAPAADNAKPRDGRAASVIPPGVRTRFVNADAEEQSGGVAVAVSGDRLVISGADEEKLNELESLLGFVFSRTEPQTQWQIYYLQASDAETTAELLTQFFPNAEVGSTVALSSGPQSDRVRIIPEPRANALYVSGPAGEVKSVEQVLEFLDSNEIPQSALDRVPRSIPVEYADVNEVASVVREVFSDFLPQPRQRGRGEEGDPGVTPGTLTIGVDSQTSQIIVSSDQGLFDQVQQLVQTLDDAAQDARRTVRVVPLQNTNPAAVKSMLGTLLPKVSFTTSSSSSSRSRTQQPQQDNNDRGGSSDEDERRERIRRFFEERARSGGGSPFGGGGFGGGRPDFGGRGGDRGGFGGRGGRGG